MKKLFLLFLIPIYFSCAGHKSYNTGRFRYRDVQLKKVALNEKGLTKEQIETILSTKPPASYPVDISIILLSNGRLRSDFEDQFVSNVVNALKKSKKIDRIVLIPKVLIPDKINFASIQELGVRAISEYVIVFFIDEDSIFRWTALVQSKFKLTSTIEFIIVDSQTSAILASDKLFSDLEYKENLFELGEEERAKKEIFSEQGKLLGLKLDSIFKSK